MVLTRPCNGCGKLVRASLCLDCKRVKERSRPTRAQRGYNYAWNKLSKELRAANPFCNNCGTTTDLTLDHITPLSKNGKSVLSNLQVLCRKCNSQKANS